MTGSNAGLGFFSSRQLAGAGAHVIMTGRSPNRLAVARKAVVAELPEATGSVETLLLDTSNLGSVRAAAATVRQRGRLDGLLLNAGIVHPPATRQTTRDGNELVLATNALGHYALAGALLSTLAARRGRMVWLGSMSTSLGAKDPVDPQLAEGYTPWRAYVQSKTVTTAVGIEADRRLRAHHVPVTSVIAHPGYSPSGRTRGIRGINEPSRMGRFVDNLQAPITQSKEQGAWTLVRALTDASIEGGEFWGPRLIARGVPRQARASKITRDPAIGERLWVMCENATRMRWPFESARR